MYEIQLLAPKDDESGERYLTSPLSGSTYIIPGFERLPLLKRLGLALDGLWTWQDRTIDPILGSKVYEPFLESPDLSAHTYSEVLEKMWCELSRDVSRRSFKEIANLISKRFSTVSHINRSAILDLLLSFRKKGHNDCLIVSFWQASVLSYFGIPCALYIGVWIPLSEAHAWVMISSNNDGSEDLIIGDSLEKVMHYAPTMILRFR